MLTVFLKDLFIDLLHKEEIQRVDVDNSIYKILFNKLLFFELYSEK
jgi:hypothetical protein